MSEDAAKHYQYLRLTYSCTYENFLEFRQVFLAPNMDLPFTEEKYDKGMWDELWEHWDVIHEISRGHGKSEYGIHLVIYLMCCQPENPKYFKEFGEVHRMTDFLVLSSDKTTTNELRDRMISYIFADDYLSKLVPEGSVRKDTNGKWNAEKIDLTNGSTVYFRQLKTKRGLHVDFIWIDDPTTESSTLTDKQTIDFVDGAIIPMGNAKQAMFWMTGTPIRITDILYVKSKSNAYFHSKRPAINPDGTPLSSRFTINMLDSIKHKIGSVKFAAEYMLNPIDDSVSLIKKSWIDGCKDEHFDLVTNRKYFDTVVAGVDFSFGDTEYSRGGGDYFVCAVMGVSQGQYYLLNYYRRNDITALQQLQYVEELHQLFKFELVGLEFNSIRALTENIRNTKLPIKLFNMAANDERVSNSSVPHRVVSVGKQNMILRLGTHFENKQITLPFKSVDAQDKVELFSEEITSWALEEGKLIELGRHPDVPIAVGLALECLTQNRFIIDW